MKKEIDCAVDNFHRIAFGTKKNGSKYISETKLSSFIAILTELLFTRYEKNWYPENPDRGSGYRCIRMNTQCADPTIVESMKKAGIELTQMSGACELTIWVDPGIVSVRIGEDGSIGTEIVDEEVYSKRKTPSVKSEKSVETDRSSRSSSPELGDQSDRSQSNSPVFESPNQRSRSSPVMEYNPYCPPARVNYPAMFHRNSPALSRSPPSSSPSASNLSTPPPKSVSPIRSFPSSPMAAAAVRLSSNSQHIPSVHGSPVALNVATTPDITRSPGHIPMTQRAANYTRPRAIFPSTSYCSDEQSLSSNTAYSSYSMRPSNNMHSPNFYDIPAMA